MAHLQPPVPFSDFDFAFDPALSSLFPNPPPLPPSADLFSPAETTDLLGFLDNFNWDFDIDPAVGPAPAPLPPPPAFAPYPSPHLDPAPSAPRPARTLPHTPARTTPHAHTTPHAPAPPPPPAPRAASRAHSSDSSSTQASRDAPRAKPLLSSPQKRLNHIMSEQKRRNAIRDGYAQLIALLAPAGSAPGLGMPTRGRPKGSGSRGKGKSKGKSGVLFRAVEYVQWLEEGRDALKDEVQRVEAAAGLPPPPTS